VSSTPGGVSAFTVESAADPWKRLAAGILLQAAIDAHRKDDSATAWLRSDEAIWLASALGLDHHRIISWLAGKRKLPYSVGGGRFFRPEVEE
jgi:hypothetical protein